MVNDKITSELVMCAVEISHQKVYEFRKKERAFQHNTYAAIKQCMLFVHETSRHS